MRKKCWACSPTAPTSFSLLRMANSTKGPDQVRQAWVRFFASLQSIHGEINHISPHPCSVGINGTRKAKTTPCRKKPQPSKSRELGRPTYGVENANTWWELLIPQTPPPLPTLTETSDAPKTCPNFN